MTRLRTSIFLLLNVLFIRFSIIIDSSTTLDTPHKQVIDRRHKCTESIRPEVRVHGWLEKIDKKIGGNSRL